MFIQSLSINKHIQEVLGLKQFELRDLGQVVVLTGENGCGKTRFLSAVDWLLLQTNQFGYEQLGKIRNRRDEVRKWERERSCKPSTLPPNLEWDVEDMVAYRNPKFLERIIGHLHGLELSFKESEDPQLSLARYIELSRFLALPLQKGDSFDTRLSLGLPRQGGTPYSNPLVMSPLSYVEDIWVRREEEAMYVSSFPSPDFGFGDRYKDLEILLRDLSFLTLGVKNNQPTLNGVPLSKVRLSDGQAFLLRWVVHIHSNALRDVGFPILFDEPELHLHPKALNALFDTLLDRLPNSQFWIATHSLPLVAHLSVSHPRSIWFGKESEFTRAGRNPPIVIEGLIGGKGGAAELADFCDKPSQFAINSFATECLLSPGTSPYKKDDPQINQIWSFVNDHLTGGPLRILDFGAGEGRLLEGLASKCAEKRVSLPEVISYYAIEPNEEVRRLCEKCVEAHYGQGAQRVFKNPSEASQKMDRAVNVIVLINVLHEILPKDWLNKVFMIEGADKLIVEDGWFLIVEDTVLSHGEMAHYCGYVVLETEALRELVGAPTDDGSQKDFFPIISDNLKYVPRLQATVIARHLIFNNVNPESIRKALEVQKTRALDLIRTLRNSQCTPTYDDGRRHSYLAQLVTNITLAIEEVKPTISTS